MRPLVNLLWWSGPTESEFHKVDKHWKRKDALTNTDSICYVHRVRQTVKSFKRLHDKSFRTDASVNSSLESENVDGERKYYLDDENLNVFGPLINSNLKDLGIYVANSLTVSVLFVKDEFVYDKYSARFFAKAKVEAINGLHAVLFPLHVRGHHILVSIFPNEQQKIAIEWHDSLSKFSDFNWTIMKNILAWYILQHEEATDVRLSIDNFELRIFCELKQLDGISCGDHVIWKIFQHVSNRLSTMYRLPPQNWQVFENGNTDTSYTNIRRLKRIWLASAIIQFKDESAPDSAGDDSEPELVDAPPTEKHDSTQIMNMINEALGTKADESKCRKNPIESKFCPAAGNTAYAGYPYRLSEVFNKRAKGSRQISDDLG